MARWYPTYSLQTIVSSFARRRERNAIRFYEYSTPMNFHLIRKLTKRRQPCSSVRTAPQPVGKRFRSFRGRDSFLELKNIWDSLLLVTFPPMPKTSELWAPHGQWNNWSTNNRWNISLIEFVFDDSSVLSFKATRVPITRGQDRLVWTTSPSNQFSVRSAYPIALSFFWNQSNLWELWFHGVQSPVEESLEAKSPK